MTAYAIWSPGWRADVLIGSGQRAIRDRLVAVARRNPSHVWHDAPRMRSFDRSPANAHRLLWRLHRLGVIVIQPTLPQFGPRKSQGCHGGLRFTLGVRPWHVGPVRRGMLRRFTGRAPAPGQITLPSAPAVLPVRPAQQGPTVSPPVPSGSFDENMTRYGSGRAVLGW
jgi:hypothetical protein